MTPQRRGVRFSDTNVSDPPVVSADTFSPTQLPSNERVLHSIFSPSYHQSKSGGGDNQVMRDRFHTPSKQAQSLFSEQRQNGNKMLLEEKEIFVSALHSQASNLSPISASSAFTEGTSFWQQASWNQKKKPRVRFGPNNASNTSFDTLQTIDMLNFKFIRTCESIDDLKRVLKILQQTRNESPLLLQEAKDRMETLQQQRERNKRTHMIKELEDIEVDEDSPSKEYFSACAANISRITNGNITLDSIDPSKNSSINLTFSPQSVLHGVNFVDTPLEEESKPFFPPALMETTSNTNNMRGAESRLSPIEESSEIKNHTNQKEGQLSKEVRQLSKQALALNAARSTDQESFVQKLQDLEKAKKEAEKLVESLRGQVHQADGQTKDLEQVVLDLRTNQEKTHQDLQNERQALRKRDEEAKSLEKRLQTKIASLLKELKKSEEKSRLVKGAEKGLRLNREKELSEQQEKNQELNDMLQEAYTNLEGVKRRQSKFRLEMFRSMGMSITEWRNTSHRDLLTELTDRIKTMREQNRAAKSMGEGKHKIIEERDRLDARLQETVREKQTLQEENMNLSEKIQDLAEEVASSRAYIDKLLKTSHDVEQSDWETREEKYKTVIKNMRQQIRKQTSAVSIDLYKNAVDDGKMKKMELKNAEKKIASLVSKVNKLEKEHNASMSPPVTSPEGKAAVRRVATSPTEYLKNGMYSRSLGKPIRTALNVTSETQTSKESKQEQLPVGFENSHPKSKLQTGSETIIPLQNNSTPATKLNLSAQKPEPKTMWSIPQYKTTSDSRQQVASQPKKVTAKSVENRQSSTKNDLIGFNVLVPIETIEKSQRETKRMDEVDILAWVDNYTRTHKQKSKNPNQYKTKKVFQAVQDHTKSAENNGNTFKSPLLGRRDRRLRKEATPTNKSQSRRTGAPLANKNVVPTPTVSKTVVGTENIDPGSNGKDIAMFSPKSTKKSSTPMRRARQVGGRKALADKLRKMRSPPAKARPLGAVK